MQASNDAIGNAIYLKQDDSGAALQTADNAPQATHAPALSSLVGNDQVALNSAHPLHVNFAGTPR